MLAKVSSTDDWPSIYWQLSGWLILAMINSMSLVTGEPRRPLIQLLIRTYVSLFMAFFSDK